jgi:DNA-binding YbaB/EbfC family protein
MLKGMGDLGQLIKLQREMKGIQSRLAKATMEGSDPSGKVKARVNGEFSLLELSIDEDLLKEKKDRIEKSVTQAVNDAVAKMKEFSAAEVGRLKDELQIPGLDGMFK